MVIIIFILNPDLIILIMFCKIALHCSHALPFSFSLQESLLTFWILGRFLIMQPAVLLYSHKIILLKRLAYENSVFVAVLFNVAVCGDKGFL